MSRMVSNTGNLYIICTKARLCYLDVLKGILIILVILGHVVQSTVLDYLHNLLFRFIYLFHMLLLFAVSGFPIYKSIN